MSRRVALLGKPVAESLSPRMQNAAFAAAGLDWEYVALEVEPDELERRCSSRRGWAGANVTIPYKQAAAELCDEAEGEAVNTLVFRDGRVLGFNTDVEIVAGIEAERVCLIGAGGAAKALLPGLPGRGARVLAQRRMAARRLGRGSDRERDAGARRAARRAAPGADGRRPRLPRRRPADGARRRRAGGGCEVVDGYEALVRQGAASFSLWTGRPAPVEAMRSALGLAS